MFEGLELPDETASRRAFTRPDNDVKIDAAWVANAVLGAAPQQRGKRVAAARFRPPSLQHGFSRHLWGGSHCHSSAADLRGALMLTLERMGITEPAGTARRREQRALSPISTAPRRSRR